jgi:hypothetical protein
MIIVSTETDIAVLQANYTHLTEKIGEVREEMRAGRKEMGDKLNEVLQTLVVQKATSQMRARIVSAVSHVATGGVTLAAVKLLHLPLSLG